MEIGNLEWGMGNVGRTTIKSFIVAKRDGDARCRGGKGVCEKPQVSREKH
jgi:hypothetical protein